MEERKGFGSNFGFLMAAVGSAVGLGNIWGFPNKMGANGGFTFLVIYLILAACCGIIVMVGELALGRKTGRGAVGAYQVLSKKFKWLGWLGILSAFLILFFYCALGGYCIKYVVLNVGDLFGASFGSNGLDGAGVFGAFMAARKPEVTRVTVIERDPDVISLFREHVLPAFKNAEKVRVIQEDAYEYAAHMGGEGYDYSCRRIFATRE